MSYRAPILWAKFLSEYKNSTSISEFKTKIKKLRKVVKFVLADYVRITCQI